MKSAPRHAALRSFLRNRLFQLTLAAATPALFGQPANIDLPDEAKGERAIEVLGKNLPAVAAYYGLNPSELAHLLKVQRSLGVDRKGALLFGCEGLAVTASGSLVNPASAGGDVPVNMMPPNSSVTAIANGTAVDAFKLHSLPGITRVIYLDFDGHTTTGTSWNNTSRPSITSAPFDLDGNPSSFSDSEKAVIQRIWQRVAEDYAPFGVDVTTEDPTLEGLRKTTSGDTTFGIRVVISPTNWYNTGAGGVAYIGSFSWNSDTPCFAFTQQLANGEKYIAECVSHEVGHTVGLNHDGLSGAAATEYYSGQGNWAPIMGVGYYKPIVQFSKGEYANANNTQDDLAVMQSHIPYFTDDHGNSTGDATPISGPSVNTGGTIEKRDDVDFFRFDAGAGALSLTIKGPGPDTNVDLKAELLNGSGQVIATSDSTSVMTASFSNTLTAGTYYLKISSVGSGDPVTTGYSSYGSIGNYLITGSFSATGANQAPTAVASATPTSGIAPLTVTFSSAGSADPDGMIVSRTWNPGTGAGAIAEPASFTYSTPGIYTAVLTVVDDNGLVGTSSVVITVSAAPNVPPTAVASASQTSGYAPLSVTFSPGQGTGDTDGTIQSYLWEFGDGTTSTQPSPTKIYNTPSATPYQARLTVTDNRGGTATSAPIGITVQQNPVNTVDVAVIDLSTVTAKSGTTINAAIQVRTSGQQAVPNATVTIRWSGAISGTSSGTTNAAGEVVIASSRTKKTGTVTATVTNVVPPIGYQYAANLYPADLNQIVLK